MFVVPKKDGVTLRMVHNLQRLNSHVIKDGGLPPMVELFAEAFGGRACLSMCDLLIAFDQRKLAVESRDLTTFHTPLGTFCLISIPMGYTNSMQIQQGDITFLLQDEILDVTIPFIDDVPIKGPKSRYELPNGGYKTIPENPGIRRFVWEHLFDVNRIVQCIEHVGGTFSRLKSHICVPEAIVVGHRCTYKGRIPDSSRVQKILDWPVPVDTSGIQGFLGIMGTIHIFIDHFAVHA